MLTHRNDKVVVTLDDKFVQGLNKFFGDLCKDDRYIKPTLRIHRSKNSGFVYSHLARQIFAQLQTNYTFS